MIDNYTITQPPSKVEEWEGHYIISKYKVATRLAELPAGTIFKITSSGITKHFESLPCECCGMKLFVTSKVRKELFCSEFDFIEVKP